MKKKKVTEKNPMTDAPTNVAVTTTIVPVEETIPSPKVQRSSFKDVLLVFDIKDQMENSDLTQKLVVLSHVQVRRIPILITELPLGYEKRRHLFCYIFFQLLGSVI